MADENPMGRGAAVALDLPADQVRFLRGTFESAQEGVRDELREHQDQLEDPARLRREDAAYGRLLTDRPGRRRSSRSPRTGPGDRSGQ
jgi:hypothetical protein